MEKEENNIVITDNFLSIEKFDTVREAIESESFPWYWIPCFVFTDEDSLLTPGQFNHMIYIYGVPTSPFFESHFSPILKELDVSILTRIKINSISRLTEPFYSPFHVDSEDVYPCMYCMASILYINTNNGYTEFEDGTKVKSVANRMVTFPLSTRHRGVTQTDEQRRIVINFNYLKRKEMKKE